MVRRSERKLQPRGFFRPKPKSPSKEIAKKPSRALPPPAKTPSPEEKPVDPARIAAAAKQAALPSGSVVRQRQKAAPAPAPAPVSAKQRTNGAAAHMNGALNGALNGAATGWSANLILSTC